MPRHTVYVYASSGAYVAHLHDPTLEIAFPDDVLPTGEPETADPGRVVRRIAELNPGARVVLGRPTFQAGVAYEGDSE